MTSAGGKDIDNVIQAPSFNTDLPATAGGADKGFRISKSTGKGYSVGGAGSAFTTKEGEMMVDDGKRERCSIHGKLRAVNCLEYDSLAEEWICKPGQMCHDYNAGYGPRAGEEVDESEMKMAEDLFGDDDDPF